MNPFGSPAEPNEPTAVPAPAPGPHQPGLSPIDYSAEAWAAPSSPAGHTLPQPPPPPPPPSRHPAPPQAAAQPWQPAPRYAPIPPGPPTAYGAARQPVPVGPPWYRRVVAAVVVLAVLAGVLAIVFREQLFPKSTGHPAQWDPRVTEIVHFVENTRGLKFDHPISIDFLAEADFIHLFDQPAGGGPDAETAHAYSQIYDAFGLAVDYDITAGETAVSAVTTLGYYTPDEDRIYIRGDQLTAPVRVVLAHELTHALQAQHFQIRLGGSNDLEVRAIVEADAMRVEDVYTSRLTEKERNEANAGNTLSDDSQDDLSDVPWAVVEQRYAPYALGPALVADAFAAKGNAGVDELIRKPPTERELLNPWTYGQGAVEADVTVDTPSGAKVLERPQPLSELQLLVMLDAWLPWTEARGALDGWAGGGYASYERGGGESSSAGGDSDGEVCFTAKVHLTGGVDAFATAVRDWAEAAGSAATPATFGNDVLFEACARGDDATAPPKPVISPLQALVLEHEAIGLAGTDPSADEIKGYQCFAATLIDDPIAAPLLWLADRTDEQTTVFRAQEDIASDACGVPRIDHST